MYYKRLFTGNTGTSALSTLYYMGLDGRPSSTVNISNFRAVECRIIGEAVVQTLKDCGLTDAYYDATNSFIYFRYGKDMSGLQLQNSANTGFHFVLVKNYQDLYFRNPNTYSTSANGTGWGGYGNSWISSNHILGGAITNNSQPYRFKVIVKGDVKTFFRVYLSSYSDDNAEYGMFGVGFFNCGEEEDSIVGYLLHEVNYNVVPYFVLLKASNLEFLGDNSSHSNTYSTSTMTRPLISFSYYPKSGDNSGTIFNQNVGLSVLFFATAAGVNNPKIYFPPYGYAGGVNVQMTSGYNRFFKSGGRRFYQESAFCVEA